MALVKLFQFKIYDISIDEYRQSQRRGLEAAILELPGAVVLPTSAIEAEENDVRWDPSLPGFTTRGWFPQSPHVMR